MSGHSSCWTSAAFHLQSLPLLVLPDPVLMRWPPQNRHEGQIPMATWQPSMHKSCGWRSPLENAALEPTSDFYTHCLSQGYNVLPKSPSTQGLGPLFSQALLCESSTERAIWFSHQSSHTSNREDVNIELLRQR